jgi:hypothetical protein
MISRDLSFLWKILNIRFEIGMSIRGLLIFMHTLKVNRLTVIMAVCNSEPRSLQIYKTYSILENTWNLLHLLMHFS